MWLLRFASFVYAGSSIAVQLFLQCLESIIPMPHDFQCKNLSLRFLQSSDVNCARCNAALYCYILDIIKKCKCQGPICCPCLFTNASRKPRGTSSAFPIFILFEYLNQISNRFRSSAGRDVQAGCEAEQRSSKLFDCNRSIRIRRGSPCILANSFELSTQRTERCINWCPLIPGPFVWSSSLHASETLGSELPFQRLQVDFSVQRASGDCLKDVLVGMAIHQFDSLLDNAI